MAGEMDESSGRRCVIVIAQGRELFSRWSRFPGRFDFWSLDLNGVWEVEVIDLVAGGVLRLDRECRGCK